MKLFTFSLFVIAVIFSFGCNAENPICSTNFCAIGEVFPRSELEDGQAFSEVDIDDSVIFATLVGTTPVETTPVETPVADSISFDDIVTDAAAGGTKYVGQTVTITAPVQFKFETFFSLFTNDDTVSFIVSSPDVPDKLTRFQESLTYTLTVEITEISPPDDNFDTYGIRSNIDPNSPIENKPPISVTVNQVVSDVAAGGTKYIGKTIKVRAIVLIDNAGLNNTGLALTTGNTDVVWAVVYTRDKTLLNSYRKGQSYTFTLFVDAIKPPDPIKEVDYYTIFSIFAGAE